MSHVLPLQTPRPNHFSPSIASCGRFSANHTQTGTGTLRGLRSRLAGFGQRWRREPNETCSHQPLFSCTSAVGHSPEPYSVQAKHRASVFRSIESPAHGGKGLAGITTSQRPLRPARAPAVAPHTSFPDHSCRATTTLYKTPLSIVRLKPRCSYERGLSAWRCPVLVHSGDMS